MISSDGGGGGGGSGNAGSAFAAFFEGWLVRQEHYLDELLSCRGGGGGGGEEESEEDLRELVSRILAHYQQYYEEKSKIAEWNIFLVFSPTWFTSLERAFLWIAGFKPGLAFRLVTDAVDDLTEDQSRSIGRLVQETRTEERALNDELAKIQESVAAPPLMEAARRGRRAVDGEIGNDSAAMDSLRSALEAVVSAADSLRTTTALKVVEVLSPAQSVRFLAAAAQLQLRLRAWGLERV